MTYTHLTPDELVMIEAYAKAHQSVTKTAQMLRLYNIWCCYSNRVVTSNIFL